MARRNIWDSGQVIELPSMSDDPDLGSPEVAINHFLANLAAGNLRQIIDSSIETQE